MVTQTPETQKRRPAGEEAPEGGPGRLRGRVGRRILQSTAVLPALATLGNGLFGFAAIHFATKEALGEATTWHLSLSALLIFAAMVCDMLDGQLARITRRTSDFGAQLDTVCDVISFGVAPAVLMLRAAVPALREYAQYVSVERVIWGMAAVYMACAALRLARFNVEYDSDDSTHMDFSGLPSPAAAAAVVALVLFFVDLAGEAWVPALVPWVGMSIVLPVVTVLVGLLMVSRIPYPHMVNQTIRGKRPLGYIVRLILIGLAALWVRYLAAVIVVLVYVLSGILGTVLRRGRREGDEEPAPGAE